MSSTEQRARAQLRGYLAASTIVFIWSGFMLVTRWGVQQTLQGLDLAALRFVVGGLMLLP